MFPRIESVGFFRVDLVRVANELVDCADRLLAGIGRAEFGDEPGDCWLIHPTYVDIVAILVEQVDVRGAHVTLKPIEQERVRQVIEAGAGLEAWRDLPQLCRPIPCVSSGSARTTPAAAAAHPNMIAVLAHIHCVRILLRIKLYPSQLGPFPTPVALQSRHLALPVHAQSAMRCPRAMARR